MASVLAAVLLLSQAGAALADAGNCAPWTTASCASILQQLPVSLTFDGTEGGLGAGASGGGAETGFRVVQPSGASPAYAPGDLAVADGSLKINARQGIATKGVNTQANALGVGFPSQPGPYTVETTVVSPYSDSSANFEQSGVWTGLTQDDFAKLVVVNAGTGLVRVQMAREVGAVTSSASADQVDATVSVTTTTPVHLVLTIDPSSGAIAGSYRAGDGPLVDLPRTLTVPTSFFDASARSSSVSGYTPVDGVGTWAGVYSSKRNEPAASMTARFDDFTVRALGPTPTPNRGALSVTNLDGVSNASTSVKASLRDPVPGAGRVVLSRLRTKDAEYASTQRSHDTSTVRIANTGTDPIEVTDVAVGPGFSVALSLGTRLPLTLAPNASVDAKVSFTFGTSSNTSRNIVVNGVLTVRSTAGTGATRTVDLVGVWQRQSEHEDEATLQSLVDAFGYTTDVDNSALRAGKGANVAYGDEVLSPYWRASTPGSVKVTQLAAFHGCCSTGPSDTLGTFARGTTATTARITHNGLWGQSVLPAADAAGTSLAQRSWTPTSGSVFGFRVANEWSDPALNDGAKDKARGCKAVVCGVHLRFFAVKDAAGAVVPGAYLMGVDFAGINYDFQDDVYLIENIAPAAT